MAGPTIDVGIITIREDEFRALLDAFPKKPNPSTLRGRREYTLRVADAGDGSTYNVAILKQVEQGNGEAQDAARDLIDDLNPSLLLLVGIAASLPSDDVTLGDVVISTRVHDLTLEARKTGVKPTFSITGGPMAKSAQASVANLSGRDDELAGWTDGLPKRPKVSWKEKGELYGPKKWQEELAGKLAFHFEKRNHRKKPVFVAGAIASSDRLIKDPQILLPWLTTARHLTAIEMEAGGVYRAARERCPMVAIRGVSDIVGLKRAEDWTKFACKSAAAFTRAFLRTRPVEPRTAPVQSADEDEERLDALYVNLVPLESWPASLYIAPALCSTYKQAWQEIKAVETERTPTAWVLHNRNIFSFVDPRVCALRSIADVAAVEVHSTDDWATADDPDTQRQFVHLLNAALKDDLGAVGVRFSFEDEAYFFAGRLEDGPRRHKYKNLKVNSTLTVVSHYTHKSKDGKEFPYLRHNAFGGRFRRLNEQWYLEVTPTYRFTLDGKQPYPFHERLLSGIKRLEGNRSVLSQLLLISDLLASGRSVDQDFDYLKFGRVREFEIERPIRDAELTSLDDLSLGQNEGDSELKEQLR